MKDTWNHWVIRATIWLALAALLSGCNGQDTPTPTPTPVPELAANLLVEASGEVFIKREGWVEYVPASFGVTVQRGDIIRPGEGQTVTILCADLELLTLAYLSGIPCLVREPSLLYRGTDIQTTRGETTQIPYILHPRRTTILDTRPLLSWHDTGASSYTVAIYQSGQSVWQQSGVQGTKLRYPDDAPALQPGAVYLLSVVDEDSGHGSIEEPTKGLGFQVLAEEERAIVSMQRERILTLPLEDSAHDFVLAVYYAGQGLRGDALTLLNKIDLTLDAPAVQLWRGDLLLAMQLRNEAETAYQAALQRAMTLGERESEAMAHVGLWQASRDEQHLEAAIALYEMLGDQARLKVLWEEGAP